MKYIENNDLLNLSKENMRLKENLITIIEEGR